MNQFSLIIPEISDQWEYIKPTETGRHLYHHKDTQYLRINSELKNPFGEKCMLYASIDRRKPSRFAYGITLRLGIIVPKIEYIPGNLQIITEIGKIGVISYRSYFSAVISLSQTIATKWLIVSIVP
jgi:hypothetical protein